ncbi:unnamed protein product [Dibothriocephalus latus]|uniref:Uncharacterized protein n=1 Tax=Dibothriocephalus latus TaxID=60516 RepID=A0A3P7LPE5_DIBLA|nr:unnamed protein product [Dibothriocephalus latus]
MLGYLYHHRHEAFEAVVKGKRQTRRLLFSLQGEHINLYLRGGIILFGIMSIIYTISKAYECRGSKDFFNGHIILPIFYIAFFISEVAFVLFMHKGPAQACDHFSAQKWNSSLRSFDFSALENNQTPVVGLHRPSIVVWHRYFHL